MTLDASTRATTTLPARQAPAPTPDAPSLAGPTLAVPILALAELDRLGDEIAELAAHLEVATARLLDLIREFDARGGWNIGFRSCAAWLS